MSEPRTCSRCGHTDVTGSCPTCLAAWDTRPDVASMTPNERAAELDSWRVLEIPFDTFHQRAQELVGRPVLTHEFADFGYLIHEILTGDRPTMEGILAKLPAGKPVLIQGVTDEQS